ncbi:MAG: hypothetical protein ACLP2P_05420 [Desulfobaccales bacterium]
MKPVLSKLHELVDIIEQSDYFPSNIRLFLITNENYIRINKRKISITYSLETDVFDVKYLKCERGLILDVFSKIEFLANEIIILKVLGFKLEGEIYDKSLMLDDILENIDLFSRIKILNKWKIIGNKLFDLLIKTKEVRNGFAHAWDDDEVYYHKKKIKDNFSKFKEDMSSVCSQLLEIYKSLQDKIDFETLINRIESFHLEKEKEKDIELNRS